MTSDFTFFPSLPPGAYHLAITAAGMQRWGGQVDLPLGQQAVVNAALAVATAANEITVASMESSLRRLTSLGVQVQITELDVRIPVDSSGNAGAADLATQAQIYHGIVDLCLKFSRCTAIQTWGFTDKHSWIPGTYPGRGASLEFDTNYQPKPAYTSMMSVLQRERRQ